MPRLAIDRDFLREYSRLEKQVQDRVDEAFVKFEESAHAGQHLERVSNARDDRFRTIRITQFYRGVVLAPDTGDTYTLLKVLPHDDAYTWAQRRAVTVNSATGRIEIRDVSTIEATLPELSQLAEKAPSRMFDAVNDADLRRLGIDEQTLAFARTLTDPVQLDVAQAFLPHAQWDVLAGLAAGLSPEEVWAELGEVITGEQFDPRDLDAAIQRSPERVVLVDGPDELLAVLRHPFARWRIYLHPVQRKTAFAAYRGPAKVSGGPGTGKTVVALHRAHHLAEHGVGKVLLTTFTSTLTGSLSAGVKLLVDAEQLRSRIEVRNVDQLANQVFRETYQRGPRLIDADAENALWRAAAARAGSSEPEVFLRQEWRQVVLAQQISSFEEYRDASRTGRGRRLGTRQKEDVWQVIAEFQEALDEGEFDTYETVTVKAAAALAGRTDKPYAHVVVDEAQDLSPVQWRLLRAAVPARADDLFLVGDTHQRIYENRVSLRDVGISVAGRSSRLTVNYRTTAEILAWSLGILRGEAVDDMDGGLDSIAGCRSEMHGEPPVRTGYSSRDAELAAVVRTIRDWLARDVEAGSIGVAVPSRRGADAVAAELAAHGVDVRVLAGRDEPDERVSVGTMHRMKGLEFRCLVVAGVAAQHMPAPGALTPIDQDEATHRQDKQRQRCLLFVACTRARERLTVTWNRAPSEFLTGLV